MHEARGIFVAGTDTGVGKTVVAAALGLAAQACGRSAVGLKPAQTGTALGEPGDAEFVQAVLGTDEPLEAIRPYSLADPLAPAVAAARAGVRLDPAVVLAAHADLAARHDLVIVEAAGGVMVPFCDGVDMAGLAGLLRLPVLLVARPGLGTLNHTLLSLEALHRRGLTVLGVVIACFPDEPGIDALTNPGVLARLSPAPLLGVIHRDPDLDVAAGRPGRLAELGPAGLDRLLGGTFSHARFRRDLERRLAAPIPGHRAPS